MREIEIRNAKGQPVSTVEAVVHRSGLAIHRNTNTGHSRFEWVLTAVGVGQRVGAFPLRKHAVGARNELVKAFPDWSSNEAKDLMNRASVALPIIRKWQVAR